MIGLGRRSAYKRIAHLFCELLVRFKSVGLAPNGSLDLPLTQEELGDALGLSPCTSTACFRRSEPTG